MAARRKSKSSPRRKRSSQGTDPHAAHAEQSVWRATLSGLFTIDPRSLAVCRILLGVALLTDIGIRLPDLTAMYTDEGMFPREIILTHYPSVWNWSFHFGSGGWEYQAVLFGLANVLGIAILVGFETRWATIGSWLMLISLHNRVPPILDAGDNLLCVLLFWGMFLPLGRVWSVDSCRTQRSENAAIPEKLRPEFSAASAAILIQMAIIYLFSAIYKTNVDWLEGKAIEGALAHDFYANQWGNSLLRYPELLTTATWAVFALEWVGPVLLFAHGRIVLLRILTIVALAAMHIGIAVLMNVGLFSIVCLAGLALFLPSEVWVGYKFSLPAIENNAHANVAATPHRWSVTQMGCLLLLLYVLAANIDGLPSRPLGPLAPDKVKFLWTSCGLGQRWSMFEGIPSRDGWYVARARLKDGSRVDLLRNGAPVEWAKPKNPSGLYPNHRWSKCFREMSYDDQLRHQVFRLPVAEFLCRRWNQQNTEERQVVAFDLLFCAENQDQSVNITHLKTSRERLIYLTWNEA